AREIANAAVASGLTRDDTAEAAERARRFASALARDAAFSKDVRKAYADRCAMCGLGLGLVVGAHIYPVSAPGSPDKVSNGLSLCQNHHAAFDNHKIWINPSTFEIRLHNEILSAATSNSAARRFVALTYKNLRLPSDSTKHPGREML